MPNPVTAALSPLRRPARTVKTLGASVGVVGRSGLLGPYAPWRVPAIGEAIRRYGVSLGAVYALGAALRPDHIAAVDERGASTFAEMESRTSTIAAALADAGIGEGDEVAMLCRNHRNFLAATVALGKLGADTVYLNTGFAGPQLVDVARREGARAVVLDQEFLTLAEELGPDVELFVSWVDDRSSLGGRVSFDDILAGGQRPAPRKATHQSRQIILTSGTTGTPKGAQRNFGSEIEPVVSLLSKIPLRTGDTTLLAAPMFHSWGLVNAAMGMVLGARLVMPRKFNPEDTLRLVAEQRATVLVAVPVMIQRIMALPAETRARYDTSSLRVVGLSGSALPGDLATRFMDAFGDVLYNLYGSTEIGWASIATPADLWAAPGTAGRVPLGAEVRILDGDGREVPTGDTGRIFVDGRDDDMIVSGGENVFPREVEDLLSDHPDVADASVIGVPDDQFGQRLAAFVVPAEGATIDVDGLRRYVQAQLARYKVPRDITVLEELPRNATGKVVKRELRDP